MLVAALGVSPHNGCVRRSALFPCVFVAMVAAAAGCYAQSTSTVSLSNGVELRIGVSLGPLTGQQLVTVEQAPASGNSVYRIFRDQNNLAIFAYELAVARTDDGKEIRLTAKPVEDRFAARFPDADGGKPVPTMSATADLEPLPSGGRAEIGLFHLQGMGVRVVDEVQARLNQGGSEAASELKTSGINRLRFSNLKVIIHGAPAWPSPAGGMVAGKYAMFYIPRLGGFFFSAEAVPNRPGFVKAGAIDGDKMQFTVNNENYECVADAPILTQGRTGEVWAYHDPSYRPAGNWTQEIPPPPGALPNTQGFFTAASDTLSWWLR